MRGYGGAIMKTVIGSVMLATVVCAALALLTGCNDEHGAGAPGTGAGWQDPTAQAAPEISSDDMVAALTLTAGLVLLIRGWRK